MSELGSHKATFSKLLLSLASMFIFVLLLELGCRFFYHPEQIKNEGIFTYSPTKVFTLKKSFVGSQEDKPVVTNSLGYRDKEIPIAKAPGEARVLLVGDSVTFGHAVNVEDTYADQLEKLLRADHPDKKIEVINTAAPGNSSLEEYYDLQAALPLKPDVVVIQFCLNDLEEPYLFRQELGGTGKDYHEVPETLPIHYFLSQHSAIYLFLQDVKTRLRFGTSDKREIKAAAKKVETANAMDAVFGPNTPQLEKEWQTYFKWLGRMLEICQREKIRCYVLESPNTFQLDFPDSYAEPQRRVAQFAQNYGAEVIDPLPVLREAIRHNVILNQHLKPNTSYIELGAKYPDPIQAQKNHFSIDGTHYTPAGHQLIADIIYRVFKGLPIFE